MPRRKPNRFYAELYERLNQIAERRFLGDIRRDIAGGASGHVLEIGAGTGGNFRFYGPSVESVIAIEPDPAMVTFAAPRLHDGPRPVTLVQSVVERMPFPDASFDTVLTSLVLCSVGLDEALHEIRRVLKVNGTLRFYEHVRFHNRVGAWFQDAVTPVWRRLAAGCHPNRDIAAALVAHGFVIERLDSLAPGWPLLPYLLVRSQIKGVAICI